jgi:hypothetical protein
LFALYKHARVHKCTSDKLLLDVLH